eukprot:scaffold1363_cov117-Skeletonema_dohrnii-CCMP3373.AAC.11
MKSILSSPIFKWERHDNHRDHDSNGKSSQRRKVTDANPQDEVGISPQDSTTRKINEEPQDQVPIAQLSALADMIKKRDWDLLSIELRSHEELSECKGLLLHLALRFEAPLSIISQLTHGIENSASHRDAEGRLPLHVAISNASKLSIISHVLMLNPGACTSVDDQGSTPLHMCFDENVMHSFKPSEFRKLVRTLVQISPESLLMEDRKNRCPIELAAVKRYLVHATPQSWMSSD